MKKITAIILAILISLSLSACANNNGDAPEGMQSATVSDEPFILYVPVSFTPNTESGISSAYIALDNLIVTARYFTPEEELTLDEHISQATESYAETLGAAFELLDTAKSTVLGGENSKKIEFSLTKSSVKYTVIQYFVKYKGDVITLNFYVAPNMYENFESDIENIVANFTLCDKAEPKNDCVTDKDTPEGMKIASSDKVEYRLFVPTNWICEAESGMSEAYYPESQRTNVTLTSYSPNEIITLEDYYERTIAEYEKEISNFTLVSKTERKIANFDAISFEFSAKYGEKTIKIRQVVFRPTHNELFYNFTYTATEENYELHMADFEKMLDSFIFR